MESQADILDRINELYRQQAEVLRFYSFLNQIWPKYDTISIRQSPQWYVVYTGKDRDMERIIKQYTHIEQDKGLIPTYAYFLSPQSFSARCYSDFCNRGVVTDSAYTDDQSLPLLIPSQKCAYYVFCEKQTSPMNHIYDALHDWLDIHRANVCGDVMERFILNTSEHKIGEVWVPIRLPED